MDARVISKSDLPSRHVTEGPARAPHRSYLYAMGLSAAEIARKLNLSPRTVNAQLSIGINKCADYVRRFREMDHA